jgi:hypothetical protein
MHTTNNKKNQFYNENGDFLLKEQFKNIDTINSCLNGEKGGYYFNCFM